MKHLYRCIAVFVVLLPVFLIAGCPSATITLEGDVSCTPPVTVSGSVTNQSNITLDISATVKCAGVGIAGVTLNGTLPVATGDITHSWGPTNASGTATTTLNVAHVAVLPANFHVIVKDSSGNVVKDEPIAIQ